MGVVGRLLLGAEEVGKEAGRQGISSAHTACLPSPLHPDGPPPHSPALLSPAAGRGSVLNTHSLLLSQTSKGATRAALAQTCAPYCAP